MRARHALIRPRNDVVNVQITNGIRSSPQALQRHLNVGSGPRHSLTKITGQMVLDMGADAAIKLTRDRPGYQCNVMT